MTDTTTIILSILIPVIFGFGGLFFGFFKIMSSFKTELSSEINKLDIRINHLDNKLTKLDDKWSQTRETFFKAEKENDKKYNEIMRNVERMERQHQEHLTYFHKISNKK